jgi:galactokinase
VHGGGFAGTVQAFVPNELADEYKRTMEAAFGEGTCLALRVRPVGATKVS